MRPVLILSCAMLGLMLGGCSGQPRVTVVNESAAPLENLTVSGTGFSERIGKLEAGARTHVSVAPKGESGLRLEFDVNGRHHASREEGYFEANGGYRVTATVGRDFSVTTAEQR